MINIENISKLTKFIINFIVIIITNILNYIKWSFLFNYNKYKNIFLVS